MRDVARQCRGLLVSITIEPGTLAGPFTLRSQPQSVAAQLGGRDEQISWATAEHTAPDLACILAVGYSVIAWIDGKEKVYGSIP
jgi:hypothetical protein